MHPFFSQPKGLGTYLSGSLLVGLLLATVLNRQGLDPFEALALALPACLMYAFVCLSAFYVCLAAPLSTSVWSRILATAALATTFASTLWLALVRAWYAILDALPVGGFDSTQYPAQVPLLFT